MLARNSGAGQPVDETRPLRALGMGPTGRWPDPDGGDADRAGIDEVLSVISDRRRSIVRATTCHVSNADGHIHRRSWWTSSGFES